MRAPGPVADAAVVLGLRGELLLRPRHEEVRVLGHPGVVRRHVVRDEVEDEAQAATLQARRGAGRAPRPRRSPRGPGSPGPRSRSRRRLPRGSRGGRGWYSASHSGFDRETRRAASPVCQTPRNQTRSNPSAASRSSSASGMSSSVALRPSAAASSESRTRVLTWKSAGYRGADMAPPTPRPPARGPGGPRASPWGSPARPAAVTRPKRSRRRAMRPVQPVWWLAPRPAPMSPWKYS